MEKQEKNGGYTVVVESITITVTPKRVKNVNFRLGSDGSARMSVPFGMPRPRVEELAKQYAPWFKRRLAKSRERNQSPELQWKTGDTVMLWGEPYALTVETGPEGVWILPKEDGLVMHVPEGYAQQDREAVAEAWYRQQLEARVDSIRGECERTVGKSATSITLRRMKTRWGSCTPRTGRIRLNTALAECPPDCLRMVLIHELCHLWESNHGPRFKALMDLHCPDWRVSQKWLDRHPPRC